MSDICIESKCINSSKTEDKYREVKETLCLWPYSCITWVYLDPNNDKNQRYIKLIIENFDLKSIKTLASSGQLDKLENQILRP